MTTTSNANAGARSPSVLSETSLVERLQAADDGTANIEVGALERASLDAPLELRPTTIELADGGPAELVEVALDFAAGRS